MMPQVNMCVDSVFLDLFPIQYSSLSIIHPSVQTSGNLGDSYFPTMTPSVARTMSKFADSICASTLSIIFDDVIYD